MKQIATETSDYYMLLDNIVKSFDICIDLRKYTHDSPHFECLSEADAVQKVRKT